MDPQERVEGCGLTHFVQDNIQWRDLVNMSVPHVVEISSILTTTSTSEVLCPIVFLLEEQ